MKAIKERIARTASHITRAAISSLRVNAKENWKALYKLETPVRAKPMTKMSYLEFNLG
jgi:hypothetical protein